jgi:lipopolysaccharide transport protein LptA
VIRLRVLRILLPLLLLLLGVLLWRSWEPRSAVHRVPTAVPESDAPRVEGLSFKDYAEGIEGHARVFEPHDDGSLHLEGIRDLELQREDRGPLLVSAARGDRQGADGARRWYFEEEVVFREPDEGLRLVLPYLEIDDTAGEARSGGDIRFQASNFEGRADSLIYGLRGQPGEMTGPVIEDHESGRMSADRARLLDGVRDIELIGTVRVSHTERQLHAGRLRLIRGPEDRLRQALATEGVSGQWSGGLERRPATLRGDRLELRWDGAGQIDFLALAGEAMLERGSEALAAESIQAARDGAAVHPWKIDAGGGVYVQALFGGAPGLLRAERLEARLDAGLGLREARAAGRVSFDGRDTRAEAEHGTFVQPAGEDGRVELVGDELRKARLAQRRTRIAARTIRTDVRGAQLVAEGWVEATLLPEEPGASSPARTRLFVTEQAIHFVSERLESEDAGEHLTFIGSVRGWQGERNLAADRVVVNERDHSLHAQDAVSTRFPRAPGSGAAAEADYVQIGADRLDYDDARGLAVYTGQVRVRLVEGWMEAQRVEVLLALDSRQISEIRASDAVRIEFHRASGGEMARPVSGTADRLVYTPSDATLRLFGEQSPAAVRRIGEGGGTTTGRVLRYRVDTGTLDVDSGEQGPGTIRS